MEYHEIIITLLQLPFDRIREISLATDGFSATLRYFILINIENTKIIKTKPQYNVRREKTNLEKLKRVYF